MDRSPPGSSVLGIFFQQEYWAAMPSPGDFPGIEPTSPALQVDDLPLSHQESPGNNSICPKHSKFKITRQISAKFENSTFMLRVKNHTTYLLTLIKINSGKQTTKAWNKSVFLKVCREKTIGTEITQGNVQPSLKILNIELLYNPAISFLSIYPRKIRLFIHTKMCTWMFIVALLTIGKK